MANAATLALDRKESRHLFVRGPRLSGGKRTVSSRCLVHGSEPAVLRAMAVCAFLGNSLSGAQLPPAVGVTRVTAQEGEAPKPSSPSGP